MGQVESNTSISIKNIVQLINKCCYSNAVMEELSDSELKILADELRQYFESDYCAIGKFDGYFVEDRIISYKNESKVQERSLKDVIRVSINNKENFVCQAIASSDDVFYIEKEELKKAPNYKTYESSILKGPLNDTTIIPIRNERKQDQGYIQLINSKRKITHDDINPFYDHLLKLIIIIKQTDAAKDALSYKKDYEFITDLQSKISNVDELLKGIMDYLSREFSAGIISYRIPLLVGMERKPLFFLRECYISEKVSGYYSREEFFKDRLVITGKFSGKINAPSGDLEIAKNAACKVSTIDANSIIVAGGDVQGDMNAAERVEICSGSKVSGNITTARIRIANNVEFSGDVNMLEKEPDVDLFSVASSEYKQAMCIVATI